MNEVQMKEIKDHFDQTIRRQSLELGSFLKAELDENQALIESLEDEDRSEGGSPANWVNGISPPGIGMTSKQVDDAFAKFSKVLSVVRKISTNQATGVRTPGFWITLAGGLMGNHSFFRKRVDQE